MEILMNVSTFKRVGIYVGENKVIHFTSDGEKVRTETAWDLLSVSSGSSSGSSKACVLCCNCTPPKAGHGVVLSCLDCFLSGGLLYRFEYSVSFARFKQARGGTCSFVECDSNDEVVDRAKYLLKKGFGWYNVLTKNCEDFAFYCKTGRFSRDQGQICSRYRERHEEVRGEGVRGGPNEAACHKVAPSDRASSRTSPRQLITAIC
ncbi:hypothetical protein CRG98_031201 [Punica granatum]|uniref:LRAT domain-containing protein n=1 Tax=Punica granatum TaxID=22663 RepID=A0A2I0IWN4_PUNGR|nr:hypothetical protein CRG98_031201 [Punica granatum]